MEEPRIAVLKTARNMLRNAYVAYTFLFIIIFIIGWSPFWVNGRTLIWSVDGLEYHFIRLHYTGRFFLEIISSFLAGGPEVLLFDFRIGLGNDAWNTINRLDILDLTSALVPQRHTETLYSIITVARYYLAGVTFLYFCRYMKVKPYFSLLGAISYVFCGWTLFTGVRHPFFMIPMVYLPLIIAGLDKILTGKKPTLFIISTFFLALTGFYFLYMVILFCIIYTLIRVHHIYLQEYLKKLIFLAGYVGVAGIISITMAAVYLLPSILFYLASHRAGVHVQVSSLLHFDISVYQDFFMRIFAGHAGWGHLLFPAIIVVAINWLVVGKTEETNLKNDKKYLLIMLLVMLTIRLIPVGGLIFNGFGYVSNRWMFLFAFVLSFIIAKVAPEILELKGRLLHLSLIVAVVYGAVVISVDRFRNVHFFLGFAMLVITIACLACFPLTKTLNGEKLKKAILLLVLTANVSANAYFWYHGEFGGYANQFVLAGATEERHIDIPESIRSRESFHRIDIPGVLPNTAMMRDYFGLIAHFNVPNSNLMELTSEMEVNSWVSHRIMHFNHSTILNSLLSVRYAVATSQAYIARIPYGYIEYGYENGVWIFKNEYALPIGFTYRYAISRSAYLTLNPVEKQEIILHAVILDELPIDDELPRLQTTQVPFTITHKEYLAWENGLLNIERANATMTLEFEGLPNSETYIRLLGFNNDLRDQTYVTFKNDLFSTRWQTLFWRNNFYSADHAYNYTVNMGFSYVPQTQIVLEFEHIGVYDLAEITIYSLPMDDFSSHISSLREETMTDVALEANRVRGEITVSSDTYLFLNIPYSNGWRAMVNGADMPILRANTAFMALELEEGHNVIELAYSTPGLMAGIFLSMFGFCFFYVFIKLHRRGFLVIDISPENTDQNLYPNKYKQCSKN